MRDSHCSRHAFGPVTIFLILLIPFCHIHAQPQWLQEVVSKTKNLTFHEEASYAILYNSAKYEFNSRGEVNTSVKIVKKVLLPEGIAALGLYQHVSADREITSVDGWLLTEKGSKVELGDQNKLKVSESGVETDYTDRSVFSATFPDVKVGDIVAFDYELHDFGKYGALEQFQFQQNEPVVFAQCDIEIPAGWTLNISEKRIRDANILRESPHYRWVASDLPYEESEPYLPQAYSLRRTITFEPSNPTAKGSPGFHSWKEVSDWCSEMMDSAARQDTFVATSTVSIAGSGSLKEKLQRIAQFAADDIRYVAVELGDGGWRARDASKTLQNRFGDCKDKTALMRSMLKTLGIPSFAVLLNTHSDLDTTFATPFLFNHCMVGIPDDSFALGGTTSQKSSRWLFYDPTALNVPFGALPWSLVGKPAFVVSSPGDPFVHITNATDPTGLYRRRALITIRDAGQVEVDVVVSYFGAPADRTRSRIRSIGKEEVKESWLSLFQSTVRNPAIKDFSITENRDTVITSFKLSYALPVSTNRIQFKTNIFTAYTKLPLKRGKRVHPIWLGPPSVEHSQIEVALPQGWRVETPPMQSSSSCSAAQFSSVSSIVRGNVSYQLSVTESGATIPPDQYGSVLEYFAGLTAAQNHTITLENK